MVSGGIVGAACDGVKRKATKERSYSCRRVEFMGRLPSETSGKKHVHHCDIHGGCGVEPDAKLLWRDAKEYPDDPLVRQKIEAYQRLLALLARLTSQ